MSKRAASVKPAPPAAVSPTGAGHGAAPAITPPPSASHRALPRTSDRSGRAAASPLDELRRVLRLSAHTPDAIVLSEAADRIEFEPDPPPPPAPRAPATFGPPRPIERPSIMQRLRRLLGLSERHAGDGADSADDSRIAAPSAASVAAAASSAAARLAAREAAWIDPRFRRWMDGLPAALGPMGTADWNGL